MKPGAKIPAAFWGAFFEAMCPLNLKKILAGSLAKSIKLVLPSHFASLCHGTIEAGQFCNAESTKKLDKVYYVIRSYSKAKPRKRKHALLYGIFLLFVG